VFVTVSGGLVATQSQGQEWTKPMKYAPGGVEFSADAAKPRTHRVRNDGPAEFHVIVIQFLQ